MMMQLVEEENNLSDDIYQEVETVFSDYERLFDKWKVCDRTIASNHWMYYSLLSKISKLNVIIDQYDLQLVELEYATALSQGECNILN
jgi:23S rRNA G2069 N7-methylase RlmK/C1962 C5-methylase RlmI